MVSVLMHTLMSDQREYLEDEMILKLEEICMSAKSYNISYCLIEVKPEC